MKKNLSCVLIVIFILASCAQSPMKMDQTATFLQSDIEILIPTLGIDPSPTFESISPFSTEPTATPEFTYKQITNTDQETQISRITLEDIKNKKVSRWILSLPECNKPITKDPSRIDFQFKNDETPGIISWIRDYEPPYVYPGNHFLCSLLKINPDQFGLLGKRDAFVFNYIWEDINGRKAVFQFLMGREGIDWMKKYGFAGNPTNEPYMSPVLVADEHSYKSYSGYSFDISELANGKIFYASQGHTQNEIKDLFQRIAETDSFSDEDLEFIHSTIFLGSPNTGYFDEPSVTTASDSHLATINQNELDIAFNTDLKNPDSWQVLEKKDLEKLIQAEKQWIIENPFSKEVILLNNYHTLQSNSLGILYLAFDWKSFSSIYKLDINPNIRPFKIIGYWKYEHRTEIKDSYYEIHNLIIIGTAWKNPTGEDRILNFITTGSLEIFSGNYFRVPVFALDIDKGSFPHPVVKFFFDCRNDLYTFNSPIGYYGQAEICEIYKDNQQDEINKVIDKWVESGEIPQEAELILFFPYFMIQP